MNYRYNYTMFFFTFYNLKTCMYTVSALYQIINLNISPISEGHLI